MRNFFFSRGPLEKASRARESVCVSGWLGDDFLAGKVIPEIMQNWDPKMVTNVLVPKSKYGGEIHPHILQFTFIYFITSTNSPGTVNHLKLSPDTVSSSLTMISRSPPMS